MRNQLFVMLAVGLLACNRDSDIDPNNRATALRNGEPWEAKVWVMPYFYDSSLISINVTRDLGGDSDLEALFFEKFPPLVETFFLNRSELTITDSFSSHQRFYRDHIGESAYAVRHEGDPANFLRIDSYDPVTGRLEATFQGTYVKCDDEFNIYGGDSIVFTEGKLIGVLKP